MTRYTHFLSGLLVAETAVLLSIPGASSFSSALDVKGISCDVVGAMLGSVFPDIDFHLPFWGHRTIPHWVVIYFCALIVSMAMGLFPLVFFSIGGIVHIFMDYFTEMGIPPLYSPFGGKIGLRIMRTAGKGEILVILMIVAFMILGYLAWM